MDNEMSLQSSETHIGNPRFMTVIEHTISVLHSGDCKVDLHVTMHMQQSLSEHCGFKVNSLFIVG